MPEASTQTMAVLIVIVTLLFVVVLLLLLVIWSIKRHPDPHLEIESDAPLEDLLRSLAGLTQATIVEGNAVEVLHNGAYFDVMLADMRAAERTLHFETFLWKE